MKEKNYRDLTAAIETGLTQRYGGQFRVEVKNFKREHDGNPFCAIYPVSLIIYAKNGDLTGTGPQQDLFSSNGHDPVQATNGHVVEPWEDEHVPAQ